MAILNYEQLTRAHPHNPMGMLEALLEADDIDGFYRCMGDHCQTFANLTLRGNVSGWNALGLMAAEHKQSAYFRYVAVMGLRHLTDWNGFAKAAVSAGHEETLLAVYVARKPTGITDWDELARLAMERGHSHIMVCLNTLARGLGIWK